MTEVRQEGIIPVETARAVGYAPIIGWAFAIVVLVLHKGQDVRWNAMQGLVLAAISFGVTTLLRVSVFLAFLSPIVWVIVLITQLVLAVKAYQGETWRLPYIAEWTDTLLKKPLKVEMKK